MAITGFALAVVAFVFALDTQTKLKKLEKRVADLEGGQIKK